MNRDPMDGITGNGITIQAGGSPYDAASGIIDLHADPVTQAGFTHRIRPNDIVGYLAGTTTADSDARALKLVYDHTLNDATLGHESEAITQTGPQSVQGHPAAQWVSRGVNHRRVDDFR